MNKKIIFSVVISFIILLGCISWSRGKNSQEKNACPNIVPAIVEWEAGKGDFIAQRADIVISAKDREIIEPIAIQLQKEYEEITGIELSIKTGNKFLMKKGDIYLGISSKKKLQVEESYLCKIKNHIVIESKDSEGLFWGTRTLLQMLVKNSQKVVQGNIYDYPQYKVRGLGIDVARHPMSIDSLKTIIKIMSYYKMNDLHLHLNDNELLCYSDKWDSLEQALTENYSAFRLESSIANDKGDTITSEDYYYSTEDFQELVSYASGKGVNIVPEIDTPAHSLAITKQFPELCIYNSEYKVIDLNINDGKTVALVSDIWSEALQEAFTECNVVHVGMDEAYFNGNDYANFANTIMSLVQEGNKTTRIWGSMTKLGCTANLISENVQVNVWQTDWASPQELFESGFSMINTVNDDLYIIPAGGYDYLDNEYLYTIFEPNRFEVEDTIYEVPKESEQMLGASMFVWNDYCGSIDMGLTEYDIMDRIVSSVPYFAQKVWGSTNTLSYSEFCENVNEVNHIPDCKWFQSPEISGVIYPPYDVKFKITIEDIDTVLFENDVEYGRNALIINDEGKLQCFVEYNEYIFNYFPQAGDDIMISAEKGITSLLVNGELWETIGSNAVSEKHNTFVFPMGANENMIEKNSFSYIKK